MGCKLWTLEILYYEIGMQHLSMVCYSRRFLVEVTQLGHRPKINGLSFRLFLFNSAVDPPPLKWSDLRYVFDIKEDYNGKEAIQA